MDKSIQFVIFFQKVILHSYKLSYVGHFFLAIQSNCCTFCASAQTEWCFLASYTIWDLLTPKQILIYVKHCRQRLFCHVSYRCIWLDRLRNKKKPNPNESKSGRKDHFKRILTENELEKRLRNRKVWTELTLQFGPI